MATVGSWKDPDLEGRCSGCRQCVPWALVERFTQLTRLSGSEEEAEAVEVHHGPSHGVRRAAHRPSSSLPHQPARQGNAADDGRRGPGVPRQDPSFSPSTMARK